MDKSKAAKLRFQKDSPINQISSCVQRYGIAVIENFLDSSEIEALKDEALQMMAKDQNAMRRQKSVLSRFRRPQLFPKTKCPTTHQVFEKPTVQELAKDFFGKHPFGLRAVYMHHDIDKMPGNDEWHVDGGTCIKCLIYLTDTTEDTGALEYDLGSHREGFFRMMYYRMIGVKNFPTKYPDEEVLNPLPIEGKAGTALIVNTNGVHRAGQMKAGTERIVVRAHFAHKAISLYHLFNLVLRTPLNLAKLGICMDDKYAHKHKSTTQIYT